MRLSFYQLLFLIPGLALTVASIYIPVSYLHKQLFWTPAEALITERLEQNHGDETEVSYKMEYADENGVVHHIVVDAGNDITEAADSNHARILYDPSNSSSHELVNPGRYLVILFLSAGIACHLLRVAAGAPSAKPKAIARYIYLIEYPCHMKRTVLPLLLFISLASQAIRPEREYRFTPDQRGLKYTEYPATTPDNSKINVWEYVMTDSIKATRTIILTGMDAGNMGYWIFHAFALRQQGIRVISFDCRGFGKSSDFACNKDFLFHHELKKGVEVG